MRENEVEAQTARIDKVHKDFYALNVDFYDVNRRHKSCGMSEGCFQMKSFRKLNE